MKTKIVIINTGKYAGERAYLTYDDGKYIRVTPIKGDPMLSIELPNNSTSYTVIGYAEKI